MVRIDTSSSFLSPSLDGSSTVIRVVRRLLYQDADLQPLAKTLGSLRGLSETACGVGKLPDMLYTPEGAASLAIVEERVAGVVVSEAFCLPASEAGFGVS